jgi:hypothetical protein
MKKIITYGAVEHTISDTLYRICIFVTGIAMVMTLLRFFTRGVFPPDEINIFYVGIFALYSIHKEVLHWILDKENLRNRRKSEYFLYAWIILVAMLYFVNFLTRDWFTTSPGGGRLTVLNEVAFIALEIGAIFLASRIVKIVRMYVEERLKVHKKMHRKIRSSKKKKNSRSVY